MAISVPPLSDSESEDGMQVHSDHANLESESHEAQSAAMEGPSPPVCSQTLQLLSNTCDALNSPREEMEPVVQGLCEQLRSLRSVVPHSSPNSCVIRDALEYREELKRQIQGLQSGVVLGSTEQQAPEARSTQVEVLANGDQIEIHVLCEKKPGLVVALMETIEEFGLVFEVANMSCRNRVALDVYGKQGKEGFTEAEEIKKALLHTITERLNHG